MEGFAERLGEGFLDDDLVAAGERRHERARRVGHAVARAFLPENHLQGRLREELRDQLVGAAGEGLHRPLIRRVPGGVQHEAAARLEYLRGPGSPSRAAPLQGVRAVARPRCVGVEALERRDVVDNIRVHVVERAVGELEPRRVAPLDPRVARPGVEVLRVMAVKSP